VSEPTAHREGFQAFTARLTRWTLRAGAAYVAAVAAAVVAFRLPHAWIAAAAIGTAAGAVGMFVRVRLLTACLRRGRRALAPLSVLGQFAALGAGLAVAMAVAPAGLLAAAGGVVLANALILVVGLRQPAA
jgi:hypothetical protein